MSSRHRRRELHDSFLESRSGGRNHHAIDIHAERGAPVLAVADGSVVKMSRRGAGGISLHLADQSGTYVFYYAHLERFTPSLREGASVRRGDVLGYVGTTGNAPESAPHLHFAVTARPSGSPWWDGSPLNPYHLLRSAQEP